MSQYPERYWHCRIRKGNQNQDVSLTDLSLAELRSQVVEPFKTGRRFLVGGVVVSSDDIDQIQIVHTPLDNATNSRSFYEQLQRSNEGSGVLMLGPYPGPYYDSNAKDYTHEFLFGDDSASNGMPAMGNRPAGFASEVFVVHGHDDALRIEVCRLVERLGLKPVVLFEQADKGQTIIEKFEEHSNVGYAIVLITPDDEGRLRDEGGLAPRARQNVIFELGFFYGRLGREKVCAVVKQGVEFPSDILGVIHKVADPAGAWNLQVAREMKSAGLNIDLNRLG